MSVDREMPWGHIRVNHSLIGGVSAGMNRVQSEPEDPWDLAELQARTDDWYGNSDQPTISIQEAAEKEEQIKEDLDGRVVAENRYSADVHHNNRGLPPCIQAARGEDG